MDQAQRSADSERLRLAMQRSNVIAAETDRHLRYRWIINPHPDFDPTEVLGKRDDEIAAGEGIDALVEFKERVLKTGIPGTATIAFRRSDGVHTYDFAAEPIRSPEGEILGVRTAAVDITARARIEAELLHKNDQRAAFLDLLAHEVRNATHVANLALRSAQVDPAMVETSLALARRQLTQLERLAEDMVEAAGLARGNLSLRKRKLDLVTVVRDVLDGCAADIKSAQLTLISDMPSAAIEIEGDPDRLLQIMHNLMSNAIKYTSPGGQIRVAVTATETDANLAVSDDGVGIPSDKLDAIFDSFVQLGRRTESARGGIGVGLSLVKALVELHGGHIEAFSSGLGKGSEFRIRLPRIEASSDLD